MNAEAEATFRELYSDATRQALTAIHRRLDLATSKDFLAMPRIPPVLRAESTNRTIPLSSPSSAPFADASPIRSDDADAAATKNEELAVQQNQQYLTDRHTAAKRLNIMLKDKLKFLKDERRKKINSEDATLTTTTTTLLDAKVLRSVMKLDNYVPRAHPSSAWATSLSSGGGGAKKQRSLVGLKAPSDAEPVDKLFVPRATSPATVDAGTQTAVSSIALCKEQEAVSRVGGCGITADVDAFDRWPAVDDVELVQLAQRGGLRAVLVLYAASAPGKTATSLAHFVDVACAKKQFSVRSVVYGHNTISFDHIDHIELGHSGAPFTEYLNERLRAEVLMQSLRAGGKAAALFTRQEAFAQRFIPSSLSSSSTSLPVADDGLSSEKAQQQYNMKAFTTLASFHETVYQSLTIYMRKDPSASSSSKGDEKYPSYLHVREALSLVFFSSAEYDSFLTAIRTNYICSSQARGGGGGGVLRVGFKAPLPIDSQTAPLDEVETLLTGDEINVCLRFHIPFSLYIKVKKRVLHPQNPSLLTKQDVYSKSILNGYRGRVDSRSQAWGFEIGDRFRIDMILEYFRDQEWIAFHTLYDAS